jgi:hydroxyacid-oxoacid transhydrogenase
MSQEIAFEMAASSIRFGQGVTREIGMDLADLRIRRVMVLTDPNLVQLSPVTKTLESLSDHKIAFSVYDRVRIE